MSREHNQQARATYAPSLAATAPRAITWESRLYAGVRVARVPDQVRAELASALGTLGVEAEYFLSLLANFPGGISSHARGRLFLSQLESAGRRLFHIADAVEIATQGYLAALESVYPELGSQDIAADPWWPPQADFELDGESIEVRLRRCGFAYRHVIQVYLPANIIAIANQLAMVLAAMAILPPAGTLPAASLYQGLYDLSSTFQGHVAPHHISDPDPHSPGLLTSILRLRYLDSVEDTSVQSDLVWAESQLQMVQEFLNSSNISSTQRHWCLTAAAEWREAIQLLTSIPPVAG